MHCVRILSVSTDEHLRDTLPNGCANAAGWAQGPDTPFDSGSLAPAGRRVHRVYSAALATRAFSASSNASIRRAVAIGDFVKRASML